MAAVEQPRVGEVAVVRHIHIVGTGPHERADNVRWEEVALIIAGFDRGNLHVRRYADNADPVGCRRNRSCCVRTVAVVIEPRSRVLIRNTSHARDTIFEINVGCDIRVRVVETRIDIAYYHLGTAARYRVSLWSVNLAHVPLQAG